MDTTWSPRSLLKISVIVVLILGLSHLCTSVRVDGEWGEWSCWTSECSKTCDTGTRTRGRLCNSPAPREDGRPCNGSMEEVIYCNEYPCPVKGNWGSWLDWFECSASCGDGSHKRVRQCNHPQPKYGGAYCEGPNTETEPCNERPCPVHGFWGEWSEFGGCSATCGPGVQTSTRMCYEPQHGGDLCPGASTRHKDCNLRACPVNGQWSVWASWSGCSVTCAQGIRTRTRSCTNPPPESGGQDCPGSNTVSSSCMAPNLHCPVNGGWTRPVITRRCTGCDGYQRSTRRCTNPRPQHGGANCQGNMNLVTPCRDTHMCREG